MRRLAALMLLLALASCADSDPPPDPGAPALDEREQVVDTLMRAIEDGDCDQVKDVVLTPSEIDCGSIDESAGMLERDRTEIFTHG